MSHNGPKAFDNLIERYMALAGGYDCFKVAVLKVMREQSIEPNYWKAFAHSVYWEMKAAADKDLEEEQQLMMAALNQEKSNSK